jgi:hypothetical protein
MTQRNFRVGDRVLLEDGEPGVIVGTDDDGTAQVRTENAIVVTSCLDEAAVESSRDAR